MGYFILLNKKNDNYINNIASLQASMMQKFSENCCQFQIKKQSLEEIAQRGAL
jgi:hypothetical protein